MTYRVWYKALKSKGDMKLIDNVVADGIIESVYFRWFILSDDTRVEIDMRGMTFTFSPGRAKAALAAKNQPPT